MNINYTANMHQGYSGRFENKLTQPWFSWWLVVLYALCLLPISVEGFSVNYLFAFIPLGILISGGNLRLPRDSILLYIFACVFVFFVTILYQFNWLEYLGRRAVSFILFMTIFSICFTRLSLKHIASFKIAIIVTSIYFSIQSLFIFISLGELAQNFESKDIVGSQRYGFILIMAFWILWYDSAFIKTWFIKYFILTVLVLGIALTFSRASVVAFGVSSLVSLIHKFLSGRYSAPNFFKILFLGSTFVAVCIFSIYQIAPIIFDFFSERLVEFLSSGAASDALINSETSAGTRLFIWFNIIDYIFYNPLTGSGFLGVWILNLFGDYSGSSHSQYFDILFRVGPFLFLWYLYFLVSMLLFYKDRYVEFFVSLSGIIIYGFFHETFKEAQGAFIFAMLIAIWDQQKNLHYQKK